MKYFSQSDPIEDLDLSNRAYHALRSARISTIGDLINFPKEDIPRLRNIGKKTATEIYEILGQIDTIDYTDIADIKAGDNSSNYVDDSLNPTFTGQDGKMYYDIPIKDLGLSIRPYNCLKREGIEYYSQLINMGKPELLDVRSIGKSSFMEICRMKKKVNLLPVSRKQKALPEKKDMVNATVCRYIVSNITKKLRINAKQLFELILPLFDDEDKNDCPLVLKANPSLLENLSDIPLLHNIIKEVILQKLKSASFGLSWGELLDLLPDCMKDESLLDSLLEEMERQGSIFSRHDHLYERKYPSAMEYAASLPKETERITLQDRLKGKTLAEIGSVFGLSRERIRQVEVKCLRKAPKLMEDQYAFVYKKYDISEQDFIKIFKEWPVTYNYLIIAYKRGKHSLKEFIMDPDVPERFKKTAEDILYKDYVVLDGERVPCSRRPLSEYVLRLSGNKSLTFEEFTQLYQMLLEDLGLENDPKLSVTERGYKDRLFASNHVLCSRGLRFRYYNIDSYDFTELLDTLDLNQYKDMELSTLKFFREYPELMKDYDIHDEYELHNLLKKICMQDAFPDLHFGRMPIMEFGKVNRDKQVKELLFSLAPVTRMDLTKAYEEEYGVLSQTVGANYLGNFDQYFFDGIYKIDFPMLPGIMLSRMKQLLPREFYLMSDVYKIYLQEFPHSDSSLINPFSLRSLGFRSYVDYVISDKYPTSAEFFHTILTKEDTVNTDFFPKGLINIGAYTSELYNLKASYEIIEYQPHKYINIRRLKDVGIDKDLLKNYSDKVYKETAHMQYFTVYSLRKSGFTHDLDKAVFGEWFYASILSEDKSHFSYQRMGKNKLFQRGDDHVCLKDFLEWLVYSSESLSLDIQDIEDQLTNTYNISIEGYRIIEIIRGSSMYYEEDTKRAYADYTVYVDS